jgi:thioredoxin-like negative regulator of GroEL
MTSETLEVALQARDRPMVIDFYATWCGPCLLMAKELEKVAAEMGKAVRIVKLDVDANPDIASQV